MTDIANITDIADIADIANRVRRSDFEYPPNSIALPIPHAFNRAES